MTGANNLSLGELNNEIKVLLQIINEQVSMEIQMMDINDEIDRLRRTYDCYKAYSDEVRCARSRCELKYHELMENHVELKRNLDALYVELAEKWPYISYEQWHISPPFTLEIVKEPRMGFRQTAFAKSVASGYAHGIRNIVMPYRAGYKMSRKAAISKIIELKTKLVETQDKAELNKKELKHLQVKKATWEQQLAALKEDLEFNKRYPESFGEYHDYCSMARSHFRSRAIGVLPQTAAQCNVKCGEPTLEKFPKTVWPASLNNATSNVFASEFFDVSDKLTIESDDSHDPSLNGEDPDSVFQPAPRFKCHGRSSEASDSPKTPLSTSSCEDAAMRIRKNRIGIVDQSALGRARV